MSITDELRGFADDWDWLDPKAGESPRKLRAIADRIDAEHERGMADAYLSGTPTDGQMAEHGWVRLPKDADGAPWHLGDKTEDGRVVTHLNFSNEGWSLGLSKHDYSLSYSSHFPSFCHHYKPPTVEDVLREFGSGWYEQMNGPETFDIADYVERYAAKLRLAEGEDA